VKINGFSLPIYMRAEGTFPHLHISIVIHACKCNGNLIIHYDVCSMLVSQFCG